MNELFKTALIGFEAFAVVVLIFGTVIFTGRFVQRWFQGTPWHLAYQEFRHGLGRTLLVALDLLVAADIILTIILDLSFKALGKLGLLLLIRTCLHFILELEITGRWPWQGAHGSNDALHE